jgi:hypothetical protein
MVARRTGLESLSALRHLWDNARVELRIVRQPIWQRRFDISTYFARFSFANSRFVAMRPRLRLFVKKRGTRRTGPRWPGMLAEALLFLGLIALGAYGLYWLIGDVLMAEGSRHGWWPWLAIVIPIALVGYGATALVVLLWENVASSERRAAVVQMASEWELPIGEAKAGRVVLPGIPPFDAVTDSPGVRLAYRLPIDAASGWVTFTMAAVCLVWNTLVAIIVYRVIWEHLEGRPNWPLTWLMVPIVLAGVWTLVALARQVAMEIAVGTTRIEVSHHPLYPGGTFQASVSQTGRLHVRWFQVHLVCEEHAVYQQGTDTRHATNRVYRSIVFSQRKFDITPHRAFEADFSFTVPATAMHSFASGHNAVTWTLVVRGRLARWGDFERRFPVYVYPAGAVETSRGALLATSMGR